MIQDLYYLCPTMKLNVLICTLNEGIVGVPQVVLSPRHDVEYIVSMQYTHESYLQQIPAVLRERSDVHITTLQGKGLSRNRNNALRHATGDIALIADDDVRYKHNYFDTIIATFEQNREVDIAQFKLKRNDGVKQKPYPNHTYSYPQVPRGMYAASIELALRIERVQGKCYFDERFGLGSPYFICGEEDIFLYEAVKAGMKHRYFPNFVVEHTGDCTGSHTYTDERVMMAQGAVHYHLSGSMAWVRMFKFAVDGALKGKGSFVKLLQATYKGINHYRKVVQYESPIGR